MGAGRTVDVSIVAGYVCDVDKGKAIAEYMLRRARVRYHGQRRGVNQKK